MLVVAVVCAERADPAAVAASESVSDLAEATFAVVARRPVFAIPCTFVVSASCASRADAAVASAAAWAVATFAVVAKRVVFAIPCTEVVSASCAARADAAVASAAD